MLDQVAQLIVNGLVTGTLLAVPAIGFTAIFAVLRFPNFAVASIATIGAFAGYVANVYWGLPVVIAVLAAFLAAGLTGVITDELVLRPLRPHGALTTAIASIALVVLLENIVRFGFGNELRGYDLPIYRDWRIFSVRVGPQQLVNMAMAIVCMLAVFLFLSLTRTGKAMRAVADNPALASLKGIDAVLIGRLVNLFGMGLVGIGGMLIGLDTSIDPLTGFRTILAIFAAAVLGGLGSIPGAVVGAFAIGVAEELSLLFFEPTYRSAVGFFAILFVLSFRPQGILGQRLD